jgi:Fe-S cluster assembly protein SufD
MSAKTYTSGEHWAEPLLIESGSQSRHIILEAGAMFHATAFALAVADGGPAASLSLTVDMKGKGAEFHLHALYIAEGVGERAGKATIEVTVNHLAPGCTSRQLIKGIASGEAVGSFKGMVHVAPGAQKTDATQRNQNLQLSDTAQIRATPGLEIYADDVKCSHGATVGRLDEEAIYYMRQRGVSEVEARRMQMHGFAAEIVNHCHSEEKRETIGGLVARIIDNI